MKTLLSKKIFLSIILIFSLVFYLFIPCFATTFENAAFASKRISAGGYHSLSLKSDGSVAAWGDNGIGQCNVPEGLSGVVAVSAGYAHSLALKADGYVVAWGYNYYGQCNVPSGLSGVVAVSAGYAHSLALKSDGSVAVWGDNYYGQCNVPSGLSGVVAVSAGGYHSLALKADGTIVAWGLNYNGQCNVPSGLSGVVAVSAGEYHSLALKADGTIVAWGRNYDGQCNVPSGLSGVVAVSAGECHSLALKTDGTIVAWGANYHEQCTVPAGLSGVVVVSAGYEHSLALKADGSAAAWGDNYHGQCNVPAGLNLSWGRLSNLMISQGVLSPSYKPDTQSYSAIMDYNNSSINLTPYLDGSYPAVINIQGHPVASGSPAEIALLQGANSINASVTTDDGLVFSYNLTAIRRANATLSSLAVSPGTLTPVFDPQVTTYTTAIGYNEQSIKVFASPSDPMASVKVNGVPATGTGIQVTVNPGANFIIIEVTASDGLTKDYFLTANRALNPGEVTIAGTIPSNGAKGVSVKIPFTISFDKAIKTGPNYNMISVAKGNKLVEASLSISGNKLVIVPKTGHFSHYDSYTVKIPAEAVKGVDDSTLSSPSTYTFKTGGWWDSVTPSYLLSKVSRDNKNITMYFDKNVVNNLDNDTALKAAVSFASNKTNFSPLGVNDTVKISKNTLIVTFNQPITGKNNVIKIAGDTLKDSAGNIVSKDVVTKTLRAR